jgi:uncharacterized membrane protein YhfC
VHLDFLTFCLISVPGFLAGVMAGKLIAGNRGKWLRKRFGIAWKMISFVGLVGYFLLTTITLGVMVVYLANSNDIPRPASFWVTILAGLWMLYNVIYELIEVFIKCRVVGAKERPVLK